MEDSTGDIGVSGAGPAPRPLLPGRQKAAIIVRLSLSEGIDLPLSRLPDHLQADLTRAMSALSTVDRATLRAIAAEFVEDLDALGLSFSGGLEGALAALDGAISAEAAARLRTDAGLPTGDPWTRIGEIAAARLVPILPEGSAEVGAVILSKLKVSLAADLLHRLPGDRARRITLAVSRTARVRPSVVETIGHAVLSRLEAEPQDAFDTSAGMRVGAILNSSPAATRDALLDGIAAEDARFAEDVRRAVFTFADIPGRLDPQDAPKLVRSVEPQLFNRAIAAALASGADTPEGTAADFLLENISQRMAGQIRDEAEGQPPLRPEEAEAAMAALVAEIREMEETGEIRLTMPED